MQTLVTFVFKFLAALPLAWLHKLGNLLGSLGFRVLSKDRRRVFENMKLAGLNPTDEAVKKVFRETAKGGLELPVAFFRRPEEIENLFVSVNGWEHVQTALRVCCLSRRTSAAMIWRAATSASSCRFR